MVVAGFLLITASLLFFIFSGFTGVRHAEGAFFVNYAMAVGYTIAVFVKKFDRNAWAQRDLRYKYQALALVLWFISAFALNRDMVVFDKSADWLCVWIVLSSCVLLLAAFCQSAKPLTQHIIYFLLGTSVLLFLYYAIYLLPLYLISIIGMLAIGISFHTYIPALLSILGAVLLHRAVKNNRKLIWSFSAGFTLPLIVAIVFTVVWVRTNRQMVDETSQSQLRESKLPAWVNVAQKVDRSFLTEMLLKTGLTYVDQGIWQDWNGFGGMSRTNFEQAKEHNPLVVFASIFCLRPDISDQERINILGTMHDIKHLRQERLWSGDMLQTQNVITNIKLFPEYRMAYTEKTLSIKNVSSYDWNQQEAIYTFHLPEGSVVSSLSLWIDGREQKSHLSAKSVADSAYQQVVGQESRDPSVVHWQEGNMVSVRVFPCTPKENRQFKLGVTSPLKKVDNHLIYENIYFQGPVSGSAYETVQLDFGNKPAGFETPDGFKRVAGGAYQSVRDYEPYWEIQCPAPPLSNHTFGFDGQSYQVADHGQQLENFNPTTVYLDINSSWSRDDLVKAVAAVKTRPIYVYDDKPVLLTRENMNEEFDYLHGKNFTMFPVEAVKNDNTLVITKTDGSGPGLDDLDSSDFAKSMTGYLSKHRAQIHLFNLGNQLNPYLKGLKELRVFNYDEGDFAKLNTLLTSNQYLKNPENDSTVLIGQSQMIIRKVAAATGNNNDTPDHLLRLFAYNDIMKKLSTDYFSGDKNKPEIVAEAEQAYIASPVSSLIVLESKEDYKRFGISDNDNSLKNASMHGSGSAPEPGEWLLIILCGSVIAYLVYSTNFKKQLI